MQRPQHSSVWLIGAAVVCIGGIAAVMGLQSSAPTEGPQAPAGSGALKAFYQRRGLPLPPEGCRPEQPEHVAPLTRVAELLLDGAFNTPRAEDAEALKIIEGELAQAEEGFGEISYLRAHALLNQGAPRDEVYAALEAAVRSCDEMSAAFNLHGQLLAADNKLVPAVRKLKRAVATGEGYGDPQVQLALTYLKKGDKPRALAQLNELLVSLPDYAPGYTARGEYHLAEGNVPQAIVDIKRATQLAHKDARAFLMLGKAYLMDHKEAEARVAMCAAKALGAPSAAQLCP